MAATTAIYQSDRRQHLYVTILSLCIVHQARGTLAIMPEGDLGAPNWHTAQRQIAVDVIPYLF